jgi:RimJ/RimL family protein N-acetyltransferase
MGPGGGRVPFPDDDDESENENEDEDYDVKLKRLGLRFETEMVGCMFPEYWRSGFGTEAALAALEWAFRSGIYGDVIHAFADPRNVGSVGVLLKLGMRQLADPTKPHPSLTKHQKVQSQRRQLMRLASFMSKVKSTGVRRCDT